MKKIIYFIIAASVVFGCGSPEQKKTAKQVQSEKAKQAADSLNFTANSEIDNIKNRLKLTSNPGQIGFVLLMNEAGQPIWYGSVKGKVTSGSKRLTPVEVYGRVPDADGGTTCCYVHKAPSDEGTHGSSNPYVYFWTVDGQYMQWNGKYLYSDKPFRLNIKPLAVSITK